MLVFVAATIGRFLAIYVSSIIKSGPDRKEIFDKLVAKPKIKIFLRTNSCENILHLSNDKNAMKKGVKNLQIRIFVLPLQSQSANGALVQLVRIRACHARGQGFESPSHRETLIASD